MKQNGTYSKNPRGTRISRVATGVSTNTALVFGGSHSESGKYLYRT